MANRINALEELTKDILEKLNHITYEELAEFVEQRGELTNELIESFRQCPPEAEEQLKLRSLLAYDQQLSGHMDALKSDASQWLLNRNQAKMQRNAYEAGYAPDSVLMDRRK
ncbi:hypothetical protein H7K49_03295 [Paenibacillus typhae]|nr:hypothetical protein [Paenibacillus typhae]